jgi:hypothetical protein
VLELENTGISSGLGFVRVCIVIFFTIIIFCLKKAGKEGGGMWASCEVPQCPRTIIVFFLNLNFFFLFTYEIIKFLSSILYIFRYI